MPANQGQFTEADIDAAPKKTAGQFTDADVDPGSSMTIGGAIQTKPGGPIYKDATSIPPSSPSLTQKAGQALGDAARWGENQLPVAGMAVGGLLGSEAPGPGNIAGAALGGAAGESLKRALQNKPLNKEAAVDIPMAGVQGAQGEMGGQIIGKGLEAASPYVGKAVNKIIPPSIERALGLYERGAAPAGLSAEDQELMRNNFQRAAKYIAPETRNYPIATGEGSVMQSSRVVHNAADNLWQNNVEPVINTYKDVQRPGSNIADQIRGSFTDLDRTTRPGVVKAGDQLASFFDNRPISVGEMSDMVRNLNSDKAVSRYFNMSPNEQVQAELADPSLRSKVTALNALRGEMFDAISDSGGSKLGEGFAEARKDWGALRSVEDQIRGTKVPTPQPLYSRLGNTVRGMISPRGADLWLRPNETLFNLNNPNRLIPKAMNVLGKTDLQAPTVTPPVGPFNGLLPPTAPESRQITSGSIQIPPTETSGTPPGYQPPFKGGYPPLAENRQLPPAGGGSGPATSAGPGGGIFPTNPAASSGRVPSAIPLADTTPSPILPPDRQLPPAGGTGTGGAPNSDVMAPKVGTQPMQPTQMPASPPQATVSPYLTGKHDFAIIPAETPVHRAIAMKELRGQGYHPQVITGASEGQPGTSLFIPDMPTHAALDFQQHMTSSYGQQTPQSIITKQGLINLDRGTATPIDFSRTIFGPDAAAKPSYSIATGGSESMPFALNPSGKEIPIKTPYEGEHYSDTVPSGAKRISGSRGVQASPDTAARLQVSPNDAVPRVYFQDKGTVAMGPTGKNVHAFKGELSIADISTNPTYKNAYIQAAQEAQSKGVPPNAIKAFARTKAESALQQAGWDGYRNPKFPGITAKFGDADVFKPGEEPEAPPLEPHPNAPEPTVQPAPSPTRRGASGPSSAPKSRARNGSGESSASQEAINRAKSEKTQGVQRLRIDTRSGTAMPLIGVDAVDARPGPFDVIVQRQNGNDTVLDRGIRAQYPFPSGQKWR